MKQIKQLALGLLLTAAATTAFGQVGIGTELPDASAILDVESNTKGVLPPRMTEAQRDAIASPASGLVIYNLSEHCLNFFDSSNWISICNGGSPSIPPLNYRLGGSGSEFAESIQQTADGGYIVAGYSPSPADGDKSEGTRGGVDYWIVKLNADGTKAWDKTYGGSGSDQAQSIQQTADGGYIVAGYSTSPADGDKSEGTRGGSDYWIVKLNGDGTKAWDKRYGGSGDDYAYSIQQTADGGYIVAGLSYHASAGNGDQTGVTSRGSIDCWILKLNGDGTKAWGNRYGGSAFDYAYSIQQTVDGGYVVAGSSTSPVSGDKSEASRGGEDYWILKLNADGTKAWDKRYGGSGYELPSSIQQTADGGYIVAGYSDSPADGDKSEGTRGAYDYWIVKLNADGTKAWDKTYGGSGFDFEYSTQQTADGGYIVAGSSEHASAGNGDQTGVTSWGSNDYWIVKLNADGTKAWDKRYGGSGVDRAESIWQTADGGYIVAGESAHASAGNGDQADLISRGGYDMWILLLDASGNIVE